jgi:hypothetical protein
MAVQLNTRREQNPSTSTFNKNLVSLLNDRHFFTKSHGKGPGDGIGGTVKRLAAKTSLQKVYNNKIQTPHELFNYCNSNIHNITFFYVQEEQILNKKKELAE